MTLKGSLAYLAYLVLAVGVILLALEGAGRVFVHWKYGVPGKSYGLWQSDPELGADHRPNAFNRTAVTNSMGFRNEEDVLRPKPKGALRIIAFGGSTTFGSNLAGDKTYAYKLEQMLRQIPGHERDQVLNGGRVAWSAAHNLVLMKRVVPELRPDYAILYEGVNEGHNAYGLIKSGVALDDLEGQYGLLGPRDQDRWLKRNSVVIRFTEYVLLSRVAAWRAREERDREFAQSHPWILENYEVLLNRMLDYLTQEGVVPIVVRYASNNQPVQEQRSDLSARIARERGVLVCDVRSRFDALGERKRELFEDAVHYTPEGSELIAAALLEVILQAEAVRQPAQDGAQAAVLRRS
jgi:hypothetical protein